MKIYEIMDRDPRTSSLVNEGQARIRDLTDAASINEVRFELETFVCDGQYGTALELILRNFLTQYQGGKRQLAAWISGFFGSGKSHLLKMIYHLWRNTEFPDGATARTLVPNLPDDVADLLKELDTEAARSKKRAFAVTGTLLSGREYVRLSILELVLRACGLPDKYHLAQFCFWLQEQGGYEIVKQTVEDAGKEWFKELNNIYVSGPIANALLKFDPNIAQDERQMRDVLRAQFPQPTTDITTNDFISSVRKALAPDGNIPLTILVLDEIQQYLGQHENRVTTFTEVVEAIYTNMDSRVFTIASGQSALSGTPLLQKMNDRFKVQVQLSDNDVEAVTRKVLLHKKPSAKEPVNTMMNRNAGEISKHLQGTRLAERQEDNDIRTIDYPLLPTRRRFWEECFRAVDAAGTQSQLRSQLQILNEALKEVAEDDLGKIITADRLYKAISPNLVNTGVLLGEIRDKIERLKESGVNGELKSRLCSLVFLINKLPREAGLDTGVRASSKMLADLIIDNLEEDSGPFRKLVNNLLEEMADNGTLMKIGEEFRLQTAESAEWERHFQEKKAAANQNDILIASKRGDYIAESVQKAIRKTRIIHGEAKVARNLSIHFGLDAPQDNPGEINAWMRDGWNTSQTEVINEARRRGQEDSIIHIFVPRNDADDLKSCIADEEAAMQTLTLKGTSQTQEGQDARNSMESRLRNAENTRKTLIEGITEQALVYQSGGNEVYGDTLQAKIDSAIKSSLARKFPRFEDGDHKSWDIALRRSREGGDQPFAVVDWQKPVEEHPVSQEIISIVGNGTKGSDVIKELVTAPFGWPQDAIAASLIALTRSGSLRATVNGQAISVSALDQTKIKVAEFRPEKVRLGTEEKLELRGLYQKLDIAVKPGEEEYRAIDFLSALVNLSLKSGGDAPLPERPDICILEEIKALTGTEQLGKILEYKDSIISWIESWKKLRKQAEKRMPDWELTLKLLGYAKNLQGVEEIENEINAIIDNRSLLDDVDQLTPIRIRIATILRETLAKLADETTATWQKGQKILSGDDAWSKLNDDDSSAILEQMGLREPVKPVVDTDVNLLNELDNRSISGRRDELELIPERVNRALAEAVRRLKPKARVISVRRATLETQDEVSNWIETQKQDLMEAIKDGPVIIG